jgi:thioredoxin-like negative regulator of GroEL
MHDGIGVSGHRARNYPSGEIPMSFLKLFSGPSPEKMELKGDGLAEAGLWGQATLEYERALGKLEKQSNPSPDVMKQLTGKITRAREYLAGEHQRTAENLIEGGNLDEAKELIILASKLTEDARLSEILEYQLQRIAVLQKEAELEELVDEFYGLADADDAEPSHDATDDEYFFALCGTLPPKVQEAYLGYGENFKSGFIALNEGDFPTAADYLSSAMAENPELDSYIPLELAAAYLHLGKSAEAEALLESVLRYHPDALPAYHLLCEVYWEQHNFQQVAPLLASVPAEQANSLAVMLLKGETYYQAGDFDGARDFFHGFIDTHGWNDTIARALARTYEAAGALDKARDLYRELMNRCTSCRTRIDPEIKHKYAELSYSAGNCNTETLELYLSLTREIPENAAAYYERISQIYSAQGNKAEANRFRSFAKRAQAGKDSA